MGRNTRVQITDEGATISMLAPQCKIDDINISVNGNQLAVEIPDNPFTGYCRYVETFSYMLNVPESSARLDEGVLIIDIPYYEHKKPRRIEINEVKAST